MSDENTITIKEFRMWLQGVEEMQDAAWVPNPTQWRRIREKIDTIVDAEPVQQQAPIQQAPQQVNYGYPVPPTGIPLGNDIPVQAGPSGLAATPRLPPMPTSPPPGGLFATPEAPTIPVRTPNIDTTNGNYQSSFA